MFRQLVRGDEQEVSEEKWLQKLYQTMNEWRIYPYVFVQKLPSLVDLKHKVDELLLSINYCPSIIVLENNLYYCIEKYGMVYGNLRHW
jgi:hypothetical protein